MLVLRQCGSRSFPLIYDMVVSSHESWANPPAAVKYVAPIVNLCQSSGSGKSKFALSCIKGAPGYYLVLRGANEVGYPAENNVSVDSVYSLIGSCSHFLLSVALSYHFV
jgi:hypothetical protein